MDANVRTAAAVVVVVVAVVVRRVVRRRERAAAEVANMIDLSTTLLEEYGMDLLVGMIVWSVLFFNEFNGAWNL